MLRNRHHARELLCILETASSLRHSEKLCNNRSRMRHLCMCDKHANNRNKYNKRVRGCFLKAEKLKKVPHYLNSSCPAKWSFSFFLSLLVAWVSSPQLDIRAGLYSDHLSCCWQDLQGCCLLLWFHWVSWYWGFALVTVFKGQPLQHAVCLEVLMFLGTKNKENTDTLKPSAKSFWTSVEPSLADRLKLWLLSLQT